MSSESTPKKELKKKVKVSSPEVKIDEVIVIPKWDSDNLSYEKMQILQDLLKRKSKQEELRGEHQQKQVLQDIKEICIDAFEMSDVKNYDPILEQLVHIVKKVTNEDRKVSDKLLQWSERKFETKVLNKVSVKIAVK